MIEITTMLMPKSTGRSGRKLKKFVGVTIHNTGNASKGAGAMNHAKYLQGDGNKRKASWHYAVDDKCITQSIPDDEVALHSGKSEGNNTTIGIEICMNPDSNILTATNNAAELCAYLLKGHGMTQAINRVNVFMHNHWSGKDCPEKLRRNIPYSWDVFLSKVNSFLRKEQQPAPKPDRLLKLKSPMMRGEDIRLMQSKVGAKTDGIFGPKTEAAVVGFQKANGLKQDGIVGPITWSKLF
jgi:N-acetylmuramoyl-L-alanine amidase CwlA